MTARLAAHWARIGLETILALTVLLAVAGGQGALRWAPLWGALALPLAALGTSLFPTRQRRLPPLVLVALPFLYARAPFWLLDPASSPIASPINLLPLTLPGILVVAAAYALAWRGEALAEELTEPGALLLTFEVGLLVMLVGLAWLSGNPAYSSGQSIALAVAFLLVGVVGLGAARWTGPAGAAESGAGWVGTLVLIGGGLTLFALLTAVVVSPGILRAIIDAAGSLLAPIGAFLTAIFRLIVAGIGQLQEEFQRLRDSGLTPLFDIQFPQWFLDGLGILALVLVVIGWVAGLVRLYRSLRRRFAGDDERGEQSDTIERTGGSLRADLRRLWQWLLGRFGRRRSVTAPVSLAAGEPDPQAEILAGVRAVYRAFLDWTDEQGIPRYPAETPDEYLRRLASRLPAVAPESALLTQRYVVVRYARVPIPATVVDEVRAALERIRVAASREALAGATTSGGSSEDRS